MNVRVAGEVKAMDVEAVGGRVGGMVREWMKGGKGEDERLLDTPDR